jgi:hypothetical protein
MVHKAKTALVTKSCPNKKIQFLKMNILKNQILKKNKILKKWKNFQKKSFKKLENPQIDRNKSYSWLESKFEKKKKIFRENAHSLIKQIVMLTALRQFENKNTNSNNQSSFDI